MEVDVQDGRLQNHRLQPLLRTEETNSMLIQALETNDTDLLDWCIENSGPPKEIEVGHLAHLVHFLSARYWVYSSPRVLLWIHELITYNSTRLRGIQEFRPVLEDLRTKLKAKTAGFDQVVRLKNSLQVVSCFRSSSEYTVVSEAQIVVNEEE